MSSDDGAAGLLRRLLGERAAEFELVDLTGPERYEITVDDGRVLVGGTGPLAQAAGVRAFLRERCQTQITWDHPVPVLPSEFAAAQPLRREAVFPHRYHFNVVTYAYTAAWWDWPRWERELDWLALHGINRPLILVGHEAVSARVFAELGRDLEIPELDETGVRTFLGGPAQLPFVYMGCVANWGGPLPRSWVDEHAELGAQVVTRARELGMTPVLPGFAGHVPQALSRVASTRELEWSGFATHALDPDDPLFAEIGGRMVAAQRELFGGTDHLYAADPFIETVPPAQSPDEVAAAAEAVYAGMRREDPDAVWVFQSWPFTYRDDYWTRDRVDAFLGAVPDDRMLILDLWSEHRPITAGLGTDKPWVWCMLHNFGGRPGMYGKLDTVATVPASSGAAGIGATMEDYNNDPVLYELVADVAWRGRIDPAAWVREWVAARYGSVPDDARAALAEAWDHLRHSVYDSFAPGPSGAVMLLRPRVDGDLVPPPWLASEAPRETEVADQLWQAWERLLQGLTSADTSLARGPGGRDLADVAYVVVSTLGNAAQQTAARAFRAGDEAAFAAAARQFLTSIDDLERLLSTRPEYLLGRWLTAARRWGKDEDERRFYELNARRLITVWSTPAGTLVDYARRAWGGLLGTFHLHRWRLWVDTLADCLGSGRTLDGAELTAEITRFETAWVEGGDPYPTEPVGDTLEVARELFDRWRHAARESTDVRAPGEFGGPLTGPIESDE